MELREYMKANKITHQAMGEKVGVSKQAITSMCDKRYNPSAQVAIRIEKITNGSVRVCDIRKCTRHCLPGCPCSKKTKEKKNENK